MPILRVTPAELRSHRLDPSTMGPKVESACRFVERTGKRAAIGAVADAAALCAGEAGTQIVTVERLGDSRISGVPGVSAR